MISTFETMPCPLLQPYIKSFSLREFDTAEQEIRKPLHAIHEIYMTFFLEERMPLDNNVTRVADDKYIYGLHTFSRGIAYMLKGYFRIFCIVFKPSGFHKLFGISPSGFTDTILGGSDLFSGNINQLHQQLQEAAKFNRMVSFAERYLMSYLFRSKAKDPYNSIQTALNLLLEHSGNVSIE